MQEFHLLATFVIIGATILAYASEKLSMEAVSLGSLSVLLFLFGLVPFTSTAGVELTPSFSSSSPPACSAPF